MPISERRFWGGLAAGLSLMLSLVAFNVLVDPLGVIGWVPGHNLNHAVSPDTVDTIVINRDTTNFYRNRVDINGIDTFLIGTSRITHGMDICSQSGMMRVAGAAWGLREEAAVTDMILARRRARATLLIEVGAITEEDRGPTWTARDAVHAALSPTTTKLALSTVRYNLNGGRLVFPCGAHAMPTVDAEQAARNLAHEVDRFDSEPAARERGRKMLDDLIAAADRQCRRSGLRHRILFFALPATLRMGTVRNFDAVAAQDAGYLTKHLDETRATNACDFAFVDLAQVPPGDPARSGRWSDPRLWLNRTHFSPRLGSSALDALTEDVARRWPGTPR